MPATAMTRGLPPPEAEISDDFVLDWPDLEDAEESQGPALDWPDLEDAEESQGPGLDWPDLADAELADWVPADPEPTKAGVREVLKAGRWDRAHGDGGGFAAGGVADRLPPGLCWPVSPGTLGRLG